MVGPKGTFECGLPASTSLGTSFDEVKSLRVKKEVTRNATDRTVAPIRSAIPAICF